MCRDKAHIVSRKPAHGPREDGRSQPQPSGQEPSRHKQQERVNVAPVPPPRVRDRDQERVKEPHNFNDQVVRRDGVSEKRPKSSYTDCDGSPQSQRDKRPISGPNVHTPSIPVTDGMIKTTQQGGPFNTYPRSESDTARGPSSQVVNKTRT